MLSQPGTRLLHANHAFSDPSPGAQFGIRAWIIILSKWIFFPVYLITRLKTELIRKPVPCRIRQSCHAEGRLLDVSEIGPRSLFPVPEEGRAAFWISDPDPAIFIACKITDCPLRPAYRAYPSALWWTDPIKTPRFSKFLQSAVIPKKWAWASKLNELPAQLPQDPSSRLQSLQVWERKIYEKKWAESKKCYE